MNKIKIAIAGIGNCASSLIQGIEYYRRKEDTEPIGLMHYDLGGYKPQDIEVVAAFDTDARKVGKDISEAIYEIFAPIEAVALTPDEWDRGDSFVTDFARNGEILLSA